MLLPPALVAGRGFRQMIIRTVKRKPAPEPEPEPEEVLPARPATAFEDVKWHFSKYTRPDDDCPAGPPVGKRLAALAGAEPEPEPEADGESAEWRVRHRMKTVSVAIVVCLNVGVDPPDVIKTSPCARMECWIDPFSVSTAEKALDKIGRTLQLQYERWQPKAICKVNLDPTMEEVKKLALTMRRKAKEERVLFHYNGHGVPKPTANGEIWVFNKNYTQYIPLSVHDLLHWVGSPAIYVIDCSNAGQVLRAVEQAIHRRNNQAASPTRPGAGDGAPSAAPTTPDASARAGSEGAPGSGQQPPKQGSQPPSPSGRSQEILLLAVCSATELLPMNPAYPADLFTTCLTTPIKMALRWFISTHSLIAKTGCITEEMLDSIPGSMVDRKTPKGELNWIFTAVTDSIAWNVLPRKLFQRLFRQDLLVASLFRNFLLAERILHSVNVTPCSIPKLPPTHNHPMWSAWDFAADMCLAQLPRLRTHPQSFKPSTFFQEQLTAFEVWLSFGAAEKRSQPEQLPIVLQVLLSQTHRLRALELLARFLDMGRWAVMHALSVGIFPYVLRLLQSPAADLRRVLVFIWTKILSFDSSCQADLVKDKGQKYFLAFLNDAQVPADQRVISCFVLCAMCAGPYKQGQLAVLQAGMLRSCLVQLSLPEEQGPDTVFLLRWLCLCIASCCNGCNAARVEALRGFVPGLNPGTSVQTRSGGGGNGANPSTAGKTFPTSLQQLLKSPTPALRAVAVHALGKLFGGRGLVETWTKSQQPLKSPAGLQRSGGSHDGSGDAPDRAGVVSVAYAGRDRQALPLGMRADTVVLAAEYVGGGGGAGDSAAAVLPGSQLISIDGQSVEGLSLDAVREIAEESAPTTLQFDGSGEADEWAAKEMAVAWILIHSLYDADGAVRIELVNGLAQFVAHHIDALLEALSEDDRPLTAEETALRQIWSCVLTLRADPLPSVADRANVIWVYVTAYRPPAQNLTASSSMNSLSAVARETRGPKDPETGGSAAEKPPPSPAAGSSLAEQATAPGASSGSNVSGAKPPTGGGGGGGSGGGGNSGMTRTRGGMLGDVNAIQRSQSMMLSGTTPTAAGSSSSSGASTSATSNAELDGNASVPTTAPPVKQADMRWLAKFTSTLYKENCKHFAAPLMKENLREPDPAVLQAKRWRWERDLAHNTAQIQRRGGFQGNGAEEGRTIASFDNQLAPLNTEGGGTSRLMFLPNQPYLLAADEEHTVSVWDYAAVSHTIAPTLA